MKVDEITFVVGRCPESGRLLAAWYAPNGGGVITQGRDLRELQDQLWHAVRSTFGRQEAPTRIKLRFVNDPVLTEPENRRELCPHALRHVFQGLTNLL